MREPPWLRTKSTCEQTEKQWKEGTANAETYPGEPVLVRNTLLEPGRLSGRGMKLASLSREGRRMSGGEGARQSDFGRRHFGLFVCQPPPLGEALGTDPDGLLLVRHTVASEEQSG